MPNKGTLRERHLAGWKQSEAWLRALQPNHVFNAVAPPGASLNWPRFHFLKILTTPTPPISGVSFPTVPFPSLSGHWKLLKTANYKLVEQPILSFLKS